MTSTSTGKFKISDFPIQITPFKSDLRPSSQRKYLDLSIFKPESTKIRSEKVQKILSASPFVGVGKSPSRSQAGLGTSLFSKKSKSTRLLPNYFKRVSSQDKTRNKKKVKISFTSRRKKFEKNIDPKTVRKIKEEYKEGQLIQFKKFMAYMSKLDPGFKSSSKFRK